MMVFAKTTSGLKPRHVQYACSDIGWSLWLSMLVVEDPKTTKLLTLTASAFFLASSLIYFPNDVNWVCIAMQLTMISANIRRTLRLYNNGDVRLIGGSSTSAGKKTRRSPQQRFVDFFQERHNKKKL